LIVLYTALLTKDSSNNYTAQHDNTRKNTF